MQDIVKIYDDWIDSRSDPVIIGESTYSASTLIKHINLAEYKNLFILFLDEKVHRDKIIQAFNDYIDKR